MSATLREHAWQILRAALRAADPYEAVRRHVSLRGHALRIGRRTISLRRVRRVLVIGAGKASAPMAQALEEVLGERIAGGLVAVKHGHTVPLRLIEVVECGHPVPDADGVAAAQRVASLASAAGDGDLILCCISGGASALLPLPAPPLTLEDKQATTRLLLAGGATIHQVNCVRKHLSALKGGQLARLAAPAQVVSLLLSDVIGHDLDVIGSGPTAPDRSTFGEARALLRQFDLWERVPDSVRRRLRQGEAGGEPETPKPGDSAFENVMNLVVGSNRLAIDAAAGEARRLGYRTLVLSTTIQGEAREVAAVHAAILREIVAAGRPLRPPACLLSGGETTVTLRGDGRGGRNQEFALAGALGVAGLRDTLLCSLGTDGTDGPTDAAGALADGDTVSRARTLRLDPLDHLARNDSYRFFHPLGDLLRTGPTRTNVMDLQLGLVAGG